MKNLSFLILISLLACRSQKGLTDEPLIEEVVFDTMEIVAADFPPLVQRPSVYRASATREIDILHTRLDLSFDWENEWVIGTADITLCPLFRPLSQFSLDAQDFVLHRITMDGTPIAYEYDGSVIKFYSSETLTRTDTVTLRIDYTAKPSADKEGAAAAISSDKGLFFINPRGKDKHKPRQIWTQGETENNSRWFPTFDKPNERCTQEILLTVDEKFATLSNGTLIHSIAHRNGTRTDHWQQKDPHAPYLFMIAVGEFAEVKDRWGNLPLSYFVEPSYKEDAREIFNHTPEMLDFFSEVLQYPYPWEKYAQIVVKDFVSGAMENTTAVTFGDFVQKSRRELIDNDNDYIVAHELFHHWFGDLVTCESWSNLTLNEGFANYAEYLWAMHKYGRDRADHHRLEEMDGYFFSPYFHPLIEYHYADKEDMFDAHSYNKGGLVLHMLRNYLGDEVFFGSLNYYLNKHKYSAVEVDELRMAFEDVSGEDLHWFFDQWYLREGHAELSVTYAFNPSDSTQTIEVRQNSEIPFILYPDVAVYRPSGEVQHHRFVVQNAVDTLIIQGVVPGSICVFDGKDALLANIGEEGKSETDWLRQFEISPLFKDKWTAFYKIPYDSPNKMKVARLAMKQSYYLFREMALQHFLEVGLPEEIKPEEIASSLLNDAHSAVRIAALSLLHQMDFPALDSICKSIIHSDRTYGEIDLALSMVSEDDPQRAIQYAEKLKSEPTRWLDRSIAAAFSGAEEDVYRPWFEERIKATSILESHSVVVSYALYLYRHGPEAIDGLADEIKGIATNSELSFYERYVGTMTLSALSSLAEGMGDESRANGLQKLIEKIKTDEKDPMLRKWYGL